MGTRTPTYYTGTITGQNGTLITVLDAILVTGEGWTKTYSATDKAVYTQASGNGLCFRVLDDGSGAAGAREATVRGAESATDVDTLVDPFPTVAQVTDANCVWRKSSTADGTTRNYYAVADGSSFHLAIHLDGAGTNSDMYSYCDTEPYYSGDGYNTFITNRANDNATGGGLATTSSVNNLIAGYGSTLFFCRSADGLVKSEYGAFWIMGGTVIGASGTTQPVYPNTNTNKLHLGTLGTVSGYSNSSTTPGSGTMPRGAVPHVLEPLVGSLSGTMAPFDTFIDSAYDATANSLMIVPISTGTFAATNAAKIVFQIAGTWDPGY